MISKSSHWSNQGNTLGFGPFQHKIFYLHWGALSLRQAVPDKLGGGNTLYKSSIKLKPRKMFSRALVFLAGPGA